MTTSINVPDYGKIFATADSFDELRNISARQVRDGYWALVAGATSITDGLGGIFVWNDHSTAEDDDETVIRPTESSGAGRWVAIAVGKLGAVGPQGLIGNTGAKGDPGSAGNVAATLAQLKAAAITADTFLYDGAPFRWTVGNFTGQADDTNIVQANGTPLSTGAWVRQGADKVAFKAAGTATIIRDLRTKLAETASIRDFTGDDTQAAQAAISEGVKRLILPKGDYGIETIVLPSTGITIEGEGDYAVSLRAIGSGAIFEVGDGDEVAQHMTLRNFTYGADAGFTGTALIRVKRAFQTYLERLRYKSSLAVPSEAIIVLDNAAGTSEQPVRVTVRDCYFDGVNYATGLSAAPIAIWNTGGIQVIIDNTHIQDCEIGVKLGVNPLIDTQYYDATHPNEGDFYDVYFTNNSRYQVGDRGETTTNARAFDVWRGSGFHVSNSQIYLNNNGPDPALSGQCVARFNSNDFGMFAMEQCTINGNSRADHMFRVMANAQCRRLSVRSSEFGGMVGGKPLVQVNTGAVVRAVIDGSNIIDNPSHFGIVDQRTNTAISPYDLGSANNHYFQANDGTSRTFSTFSNAIIGVQYMIQFEITGGSSITINTAAAGAYSGIVVDGFGAGTLALRDGDTLLVNRAPLAAVADGYFRAKLVRGGAPVFGPLGDYADDTAAAGGGILVGQFYRTGSAVKQRIA